MKEINKKSQPPRRLEIKTTNASAKCSSCGGEFTRKGYLFFGARRGEEKAAWHTLFQPRECPDCAYKTVSKALAQENAQRQRERVDRWRRFAPARYWNCNVGHLPIRSENVARVLSWRPDKNGRGLGLMGPPRIGKKRLLFLLAKELLFALPPNHLARTSSLEFGRLILDQFNDELQPGAFKRIERIRQMPVLILFDFGIEKLTERVQTDLYSLIDFRAQNLLPILWTTQFYADELAAKFSSRDLGRAVIGRLNECSEAIVVEHEFVRNVERVGAEAKSAA
jgi:DNA replication protein DnaC